MLRLDGRLALVRGLLRPSSELSGVGSRGADQLEGRKVERDAAEPGQRGRGWDRERRPRSESPSDGKAGRRGATAFERRAGEQNAAPPCASFCSNFTGTSMSYAVRRNRFVLGVFTISSVIAPARPQKPRVGFAAMEQVAKATCILCKKLQRTRGGTWRFLRVSRAKSGIFV